MRTRTHEQEHRKRDLPLVIAALNEESDSFLIIGLAGHNRHGSLRRK